MRVCLILVFTIGVLCAPVCAGAAPLSPALADAECKRLLQSTGWSFVRDDAPLRAAVMRHLAVAGLAREVVLCGGSSGYPPDLVASAETKRDRAVYFFIGIDTDFRRTLGGELDAVIAHEVAHSVVHDGKKCGKYLEEENARAHVACEHAVDRKASEWVGVSAMRKALSAALAYHERLWGRDWRQSHAPLEWIRERIRMLRS